MKINKDFAEFKRDLINALNSEVNSDIEPELVNILFKIRLGTFDGILNDGVMVKLISRFITFYNPTYDDFQQYFNEFCYNLKPDEIAGVNFVGSNLLSAGDLVASFQQEIVRQKLHFDLYKLIKQYKDEQRYNQN